MSCSCNKTPCTCDEGFTVLDSCSIGDTLIAQLTPIVDPLRDLFTQFGARPYTVTMIKTRWTGATRGEGTEEVICEERLLPTPLISDLTALRQELLSIGSEEVGEIDISEISPRYTEDQLLGQEPDGTPRAANEDFYYEVEFLRSDGPGPRRRFLPNSSPNYMPTDFQWVIRVIRAHADRTRAGAVENG